MKKVILAVVILFLFTLSAYAGDEISIGGKLVGSFSYLNDYNDLPGGFETNFNLWAPFSWDYTELDVTSKPSEDLSIDLNYIIPGNAIVDVFDDPGNSINLKGLYLSYKGDMEYVDEIQAGRLIVPFALNMSPGFGFGQVFGTVDGGPKGSNCNQGDGIVVKGSVNEMKWMFAGTRFGFIGHDVIEGNSDALAFWGRVEKDFDNLKVGLSYVTQEGESAFGLHALTDTGKINLAGEYIHINRFSQDFFTLKASTPIREDTNLWIAHYIISDDTGTRNATRIGADYDFRKNLTLRVTGAFDNEAIFVGDGFEAAIIARF
ncbi:MAG: porin [Armatimonadota bacterium]